MGHAVVVSCTAWPKLRTSLAQWWSWGGRWVSRGFGGLSSQRYCFDMTLCSSGSRPNPPLSRAEEYGVQSLLPEIVVYARHGGEGDGGGGGGGGEGEGGGGGGGEGEGGGGEGEGGGGEGEGTE
eukprot:2836734-Prymnesium_polylepis.1